MKVQKLKENWYTTAADVAAMSQVCSSRHSQTLFETHMWHSLQWHGRHVQQGQGDSYSSSSHISHAILLPAQSSSLSAHLLLWPVLSCYSLGSFNHLESLICYAGNTLAALLLSLAFYRGLACHTCYCFSQEEVKLMGIPVRLWAVIQQAVHDVQPVPTPNKHLECESLLHLTSAIADFSAIKQAVSATSANPEEGSSSTNAGGSGRLDPNPHVRHRTEETGTLQKGGLPGLMATYNLSSNGRSSQADSSSKHADSSSSRMSLADSSSSSLAGSSIASEDSSSPLPVDIMQRRMPKSTTGVIISSAAGTAARKPPPVRRVPLKDTTPYSLQVSPQRTASAERPSKAACLSCAQCIQVRSMYCLL